MVIILDRPCQEENNIVKIGWIVLLIAVISLLLYKNIAVQMNTPDGVFEHAGDKVFFPQSRLYSFFWQAGVHGTKPSLRDRCFATFGKFYLKISEPVI